MRGLKFGVLQPLNFAEPADISLNAFAAAPACLMLVNLGRSLASPAPTIPVANLFGIVVSVLYPAPNVFTPSPPAILLRRLLVLPGLRSSFILDLPELLTTG